MVERSPFNLYFIMMGERNLYLIVGEYIDTYEHDNTVMIRVPKKFFEYIVKRELKRRLLIQLDDSEEEPESLEEQSIIWGDLGRGYVFAGHGVNVDERNLSELVGENEAMIEASEDFLEFIAQREINKKLRKSLNKLKKVVKQYQIESLLEYRRNLNLN